jgi:starvation-inducible DNA-binding protein
MSLSTDTSHRVGSLGLANAGGEHAVTEVSAALTTLLADTFTLYFKTKSFHWHIARPNFLDFQPMLDEQAEQILAVTDVIAKRVCELGGTTLRSIGHIGRLQRLADNDADFVPPADMLTELASDNRQLASFLRLTRDVCEVHRDFVSANHFEAWIDEAEGRTWFLIETWRSHIRSTAI